MFFQQKQKKVNAFARSMHSSLFRSSFTTTAKKNDEHTNI
jgi:hypothetical protein